MAEKKPKWPIYSDFLIFVPCGRDSFKSWDLNEGKHLYTLEAGCNINTLTFSPNRYWTHHKIQSTVWI